MTKSLQCDMVDMDGRKTIVFCIFALVNDYYTVIGQPLAMMRFSSLGAVQAQDDRSI